ncbi:MAG TPA: HTH domain-containing protein [Acidimicrobiales bacterium]|nr:HTH domain-containing protein [Acidimicrobiales bacterium]
MQHNRHLHAVRNTNGVTPDPLPTAEQLVLGAQNHPVVQARIRAVRAAVRAGTYRGRDGRSHLFTARHLDVMTELCLAANRLGEVLPQVLTLQQLADELERDRSWVRRDVRDLEAALLVWKRPVVDGRGRRFIYTIPGMVAPLKDSTDRRR